MTYILRKTGKTEQSCRQLCEQTKGCAVFIHVNEKTGDGACHLQKADALNCKSDGNTAWTMNHVKECMTPGEWKETIHIKDKCYHIICSFCATSLGRVIYIVERGLGPLRHRFLDSDPHIFPISDSDNHPNLFDPPDFFACMSDERFECWNVYNIRKVYGKSGL